MPGARDSKGRYARQAQAFHAEREKDGTAPPQALPCSVHMLPFWEAASAAEADLDAAMQLPVAIWLRSGRTETVLPFAVDDAMVQSAAGSLWANVAADGIAADGSSLFRLRLDDIRTRKTGCRTHRGKETSRRLPTDRAI